MGERIPKGKGTLGRGWSQEPESHPYMQSLAGSSCRQWIRAYNVGGIEGAIWCLQDSFNALCGSTPGVQQVLLCVFFVFHSPVVGSLPRA